jgi:hypothetical protein
MQTWSLALIVCLLPGEQLDLSTRQGHGLIGKWATTKGGAQATIQFHAGGKLIIEVGNMKFQGRYRLIGTDEMEVELNLPGNAQGVKNKGKFSISGNELTTSSKEAGVEKFKRVP